jgi:tetratricopeptide (TPR) repeat protein
MQLLIWRQYSLEASYIQIKNLLGKQNIENLIELGSICNSLKDYDSSEKYFNKVMQINPNNKLALANLGILLSKKGEWQKSLPALRSYFSLGGQSFDATYWYGKSLINLKQYREGWGWIFQSLRENPTFFDGALELVEEFSKRRDWGLTLSLIGAITGGHPEAFDYWYDFVGQEKFLSFPELEKDPNLLILSLDNVNYYLPVVLRSPSRIKYFSLFEDVEFNLMNSDIINELRLIIPERSEEITIKYNDRPLKVREIKISDVTSLGKKFSQVSFYFCESCPNILGKPFLKNFNLEYWTENKIQFLNLQMKP